MLRRMEQRIVKIAQDVDECIFNSVAKHTRLLNARYSQLGLSVPSYEQVLQAGGTHGAYKDYPDYWAVNAFMRDDEDFNRGQDLIPGAKTALNALKGLLAIYLTTRPESLARVTHEELLNRGLPDREVVCRPNSVPLEHTAQFKADILSQLAGTDGVAVMIDDSSSTHKYLKGVDNPQIETVLYAGPMTPRGNGEKSWRQIVQMMGANR
jgi:hypothetical protein